jgi:hypothetical protein
MLRTSPDARLAVSRALGVNRCVTGWAVSFGERVVLVIEVIDPAKGLPGAVHRVSCDGLEALPEALEELLASVSDPAPGEATVRPEKAKLPDRITKLLARIPGGEEPELLAHEAFRKLEAIRENPWPLLKADLFAEAERLVEELVAHHERLKKDPWYRTEWRWRGIARLDPDLSGYAYDVVSRPPHLLFVVRSEAERDPAPDRYGETMAALYREFHRHICEPLELPRLEELPDPNDGLLKVEILPIVGRSRAPREPKGSYEPSTRWARASITGDAEALDVLVSTGVHQLLHAHARLALSRKLGVRVDWEDPRVRSGRSWLRTGLGGLFAGSISDAGDAWDLGARHEGAIRGWAAASSRPLPRWSLEELLRGEQAQAKTRNPRWREYSDDLFRIQAWGFCHFLWNHEDGKRRRVLLEEIRRELLGEGKLDPSLLGLEKAWIEYLNAMVR